MMYQKFPGGYNPISVKDVNWASNDEDQGKAINWKKPVYTDYLKSQGRKEQEKLYKQDLKERLDESGLEKLYGLKGDELKKAKEKIKQDDKNNKINIAMIWVIT